MRLRFFVLAVLSAGMTCGAVAQNEQSAADWQHPMTPWGDPDLQGMWPIYHLIGTNFQRAPQFGERRFMTPEEYAQTAQRLEGRNTRYQQEIDNNKMGMGHWAEATVAQRLTSLLVDPIDGRFPEMTPEGQRRSQLMGSTWSKTVFDNPKTDFDTWDRCITRGLPPSMFPFNYNNGIEIHQAPGYVIIRLEMIHEARIIPLDGRPALDSNIKQWMGESRGHWEGNTLVIETTNFNGIGGMTNVGIPGSPRGDTPTSVNMHITERLTRVDNETIEYSMTVSDPEILTRPWTAAYPMKLDPEYRFYEYACHEDNTAIRNYIETSRYERAQAAAAQ